MRVTDETHLNQMNAIKQGRNWVTWGEIHTQTVQSVTGTNERYSEIQANIIFYLTGHPFKVFPCLWPRWWHRLQHTYIGQYNLKRRWMDRVP